MDLEISLEDRFEYKCLFFLFLKEDPFLFPFTQGSSSGYVLKDTGSLSLEPSVHL